MEEQNIKLNQEIKNLEKIEQKEIQLLEKIEKENKNQFKNIEVFLDSIQKEVKSKAVKLSNELKKNIVSAVIAGFAVVIALVWKDAIQLTVDDITAYLGFIGTDYIHKVISALLVTIICVIGILVISKYSSTEPK